MIRCIRLWAPVRGRALLYYELSRSSHPRVFEILVDAITNDGDFRITPHDHEALVSFGILVPPNQISRPVCFAVPPVAELCLAPEEYPTAEIRWRGSVTCDFPLQASKDAQLTLGAEAEFIVWHRPTPTSVINPWQIPERLWESIASMTDPQSTLRVSNGLRDRLTALGIAIDAVGKNPPNTSCADGTIAAAKAFSTLGYAMFATHLGFAQLLALQHYYRLLREEGWLRFGDKQSRRYWLHNDPVARNLQLRMLPLVETIVAKPIKPSYTYTVTYTKAAELPVHVDRPQCQYTVTVLLDFEGSGALSRTPWPLLFHLRDGDVPVELYQKLGDAVLYLGQYLAHSRPPLSACGYSTSVILHYVDAAFEGSLD